MGKKQQIADSDSEDTGKPKRQRLSQSAVAFRDAINKCVEASTTPDELLTFTFLRLAFEKYSKDPNADFGRSVRETVHKVIGYRFQDAKGTGASALERWMSNEEEPQGPIEKKL